MHLHNILDTLPPMGELIFPTCFPYPYFIIESIISQFIRKG